METKKTDKEYIVPVLCGGTFFTLILQAVKQGKNERNVFGTKKTAFTESDVLEGLIKIASSTYTRPEDDSNFRSVVSTYKSCNTAKTGRLPITEQAIISAFDTRIKSEYAKSLAQMAAFVDSFINVDECGFWLIKALLETIENDETIASADSFYIFQDGGKCTKSFLITQSNICLPSFLLGIWHFIVVNRKDNEIGKATYNSWHPKSTSKNTRKKFESTIGDSIQKQIRLLPLSAGSDKTADAETVINETDATADSTATAEPSFTANNSGVQYQQNNYSQTINVSGGTNVINGFVINPPDKRGQDE